MITYKDIQKNKEINAMIEQGNQVLKTLGYTEHSKKHAIKVAEHAAEILKITEADAHQIELAQIAGYMHDIGNCINRQDHAHSGAILTYSILKELDMPISDRLTIVTAIGHHDEKTGTALEPVSAALILADKTDVRRNRVQNPVIANFDIHDRVNYAVTDSKLKIDEEKSVIALNLQIDENICSMYDYFEIFLGRMMFCRKSAEILGTTFKLTVNGRKVL